MSGLVKGEALKLWTTRTVYGYLFVLILATGLHAGTEASGAEFFELDSASYQRDLLSESVAAPLIALFLGIVSVTVEWRHGTITRTLLATPRRVRVLVAKEISAFLLGVLLAVIGIAVALAVAIPVISSDGTSFIVDGPLVGRLGLIILAAALWGALGAGVGALVQGQAAALVGSVVWLLIIEGLVGVLFDRLDLDHVSDLLPGRALTALAGSNHGGLSAGAGGAVGLAYVAVFAALAWLRVRRQDIT
jgi:ABC-2 type transport system permease protein